MTSVHEKLTGIRNKPVPQYIVETRDYFNQFLPFGTSLREARKMAQAFADEKDSTVHLMVRIGYGTNATKYVTGKAIYHPSEATK